MRDTNSTASLENYLNSIPSPMQRARAEAALRMQVRLNGGAFFLRHEIVEQRVAAGARLATWRDKPILQLPDGAFLDAENITKAGLDYAGFLIAAAKDEWSGSPDPSDPDNYWIDDATGERVNAVTGERSRAAPPANLVEAARQLVAFAEAHDAKLNGTPPNYTDAVPPTGDDYNAIYGAVLALKPHLGE